MNAPKSDFEKNLDLCKQLWEEYKYRHDKAYRNLQGELIEEIEHAPGEDRQFDTLVLIFLSGLFAVAVANGFIVWLVLMPHLENAF